MKILRCSFLSGVRLRKVPTLLSILQPKIVLVPEAISQKIDLADMKTISILNYSESMMLRVPRIANSSELMITPDLASYWKWRKLKDENFGIARLKGELLMENGRHILVSGLDQESSEQGRSLRHWGSVAPETLLDALLKIGIIGSLEDSMGENGSEDTSVIRIENPSSVLIETSEMGTSIITDDETVASMIVQVIDGILDCI